MVRGGTASPGSSPFGAIAGEPPGWPRGFPSSQGPAPPGLAAVGFGAGTTAAPPRALHSPQANGLNLCSVAFAQRGLLRDVRDFSASMREGVRRGRYEPLRGGVVMKERTVIVGALLALIALFVSIGVAYGTPGSGAATVYPARGTVGSATEPIVLAAPKSTAMTRTVRVKTKKGTFKARVNFTVPGSKPAHHLRRDRLRHGVPGAHDSARRPYGLAHPPRADVRRTRAGRGHDVSRRRNRVYAHQVRGGLRVPAAPDRGSQHAQRGHDAARSARVLPAATRDGRSAIRVDQPQPSNCTNIP